jgi:hypothetical protein
VDASGRSHYCAAGAGTARLATLSPNAARSDRPECRERK